MAPIRVTHLTTVHHALDPRILQKQCASLVRAGYDVTLVARHDCAEEIDGVGIVPLPPVQGRYRRILLQRTAFHLARRLGSRLYHIHDPELIPVAYALKRATGARIVYDMHEDYRGHGPAEGRLLRALERWCFTWIDHVVAAHPSLASLVRRAPVTWIDNYVRMPESTGTAPRDPAGSPVLLYSGVMADVRGLPELLDLAAEVRKRALPWTLDLAGVCYRASDREHAEARIAREGLAGSVSRTGWSRYVPWRDLVPHFRRAHAGLVLWRPHPNHDHKIPTKFYEYISFGLPILCSDFPLWRAFVERHGCGAVVDPRDTRAAVDLLEMWFGEPETYRVLSEAAFAAAPAYQWEVMEARLLALYEDLLGFPEADGAAPVTAG
ncbi:MAG: glycosyltransferase [Rhodothermales bacterium]|nr:glycosyltransferase [Rhodothermales bacterium]